MEKKANSKYPEFMKKRQVLLAATSNLRNVLRTLDMKEEVRIMDQLEERINSSNFKILVIGEFNRGKSTLINAMLGQKVLPAYAVPTTAIINEIKWGEKPRALLHHRASNGATPPPQQVPIDRIEEYVVIKEGSDQKQAIRETPYEKLELFWPVNFCREGVEVIDSPGLNESAVRQKIAVDYLQNVDAVVFVIACDFPVSANELAAIDNNINGLGFEDIFFVCNRFDTLDESDQPKVKARCISLLSPYTKAGDRHIFFISARQALDGRLKNDRIRLHDSGLMNVEQALETFLTRERGRVKIATPARQLKLAIRKAREEIIPTREKLLQTDLSVIEERYRKAQTELDQLEQQRSLIIRQFENFRLDVKLHVGQEAREFYRKVAEKVPGWVADYELQQSLRWRDAFSLKKAVGKIVEEVIEFLPTQVESEFTQWQRSTMTPILSARMDGLQKELEPSLWRFLKRVDEVYVEIASGARVSVNLEEKKIPAWERLLAGAAGMLIDVGSAGLGATFGFKGLFSSIIPQMIVLAIGYMLVGLNPLLIIPVIVTALIQGKIRLENTSQDIKKKAGDEYAKQLRDSRDTLSNKIADSVDLKLSELQQALNHGLGVEIQTIRDQTESILAQKRQGKARTDQALEELTAASKALNVVNNELDDLLAEVALM